MILATISLVLGGLFIGVFIGLFAAVVVIVTHSIGGA